MTIYEIKKQHETKLTELMKECGLFWAFSNEQFAANKTPLKEGEKYVSIGAGGYMPKGNIDKWINGTKQLNKERNAAINQNKKLRYANIAYELNNHEAFYTGDISSTLDALGSDYTRKEVQEVYQKEYPKYIESNN